MGGVSPGWLDQLAPAHAPVPVGWWPPAPGWWLLILALSILIVAAVLGLRRARRPGLRRAALRELGEIERLNDDAALAQRLESLLRRYAVVRYGRAQVARLSGAAWIEFVVAHGGAAWAGGAGQALLQSAYGGRARADRAAWLDGARGFLKSRGGGGGPGRRRSRP